MSETTRVPPDHIGWLLHRASTVWSHRFAHAMAKAGFPWYAEARGALLRHLAAEPVSQSEIAARAGLTKQAVQQHLDALVEDGIVERLPDPKDARRRRVRLTSAGLAALAEGDRIKARIEAQDAARIGPARLEALRRDLVTLAQDA
ncbi:MarR family winged helix-turn-helix transcriptional regulator [Salinarimonas chemoclinalis]|uniref:MarR family winged helix-turn-helix transcriptional regulator n=1 Tax=Salinarimonas chemoclinalis TaxID=3241599 RepID=UPI003558F0FC